MSRLGGPWGKAPFLLITRFKTLFFGVVGGAAILAAAATAGPAFIASSERASLTNELERATRWTAGLHVSHPATTFSEQPLAEDSLEKLGAGGARILRELTGDVDRLGSVYTTYLGGGSILVSPEDQVPVRLIDRTDALENIRFTERSDADGLYIADETARQLDVEVGDTIRMEGELGTTDIKVAGLYRFLPFDARRPYWAPYADRIYRETSADTYPPPFVFASPGTYFSLANRLGDYNDVHWEIPLSSTEMSLDQAKQLDRDIERVIDRVHAGSTGFRDVIEDALGFVTFFVGADSALPGIVSTAEERVGSLGPAVQLLSLAARAVAGAILAALGYYLVKRRRTEVVTLVARGTSPTVIGLRAAFEALIAVLLGGLGGVALGSVVVAAMGPSEDLGWRAVLGDASSDSGSILWTLLMGAAILTASVGATAAAEERSIAGSEPHRLPRTLAAGVAGSAAAIGAAAYIAYLQPVASTDDPAGLVPTLMPVVLIFAAAVAGAALVKIGIDLVASGVRRRRLPTYLAVKRLAGAPGMVQVLIAATACAVGVMFYGTTVSRSVEATAVAKARVFVGSDVGVQLSANADADNVFPRATVVPRVQRATLTNGLDVAMIGIDPHTFADATYWEEGFSDEPLASLLDKLSGPGDGVRAIAVGELPPEPTLGSVDQDVPVDVVGHANAFPGQNSSDPMLIVDRQTFDGLLSSIGEAMSSREAQLWARGTRESVQRQLDRRGISYFTITTTQTALEAPALRSMLWTLGLLAALGTASGLAAVAGLILYMQARHRSAVVSSAMARRMKMTRSTELRAWLVEVGTSLTSAYVLAAIVGFGVARVMHQRLDLRPALPPAPVMVIPVGVVIAAAVGTVALGFVTAKRLQRQVDAADVAQVLRT